MPRVGQRVYGTRVDTSGMSSHSGTPAAPQAVLTYGWKQNSPIAASFRVVPHCQA